MVLERIKRDIGRLAWPDPQSFVNSNAGCTSTSGICLQYLIQQFNRNGVSPILVTKNPNLCFNCQHNSFSLALGFQNMGAT